MSDNRFWGGTIRKLWSTEFDKFRDHLLRLDKASRRMRFAHGVTDSFIEDYVARMNDSTVIVYAYVVDGEVRAAAELRMLGHVWGSFAEAAFSVEAAFQNRGLGSELMGRIIRAARNRGVQHLVLSCLAENAKMQSIARKYEAELRLEYGEVVGDIIPEQPSYFSMLAEAVEDRIGGLLAALDVQDGASRPA